MEGLNNLSKLVYNDNKKKGFWDTKRETGTILMLIVSELSEALEADRKNRYFDKTKQIEWKNDWQNSDSEDVKNFEENVKRKFIFKNKAKQPVTY